MTLPPEHKVGVPPCGVAAHQQVSLKPLKHPTRALLREAREGCVVAGGNAIMDAQPALHDARRALWGRPNVPKWLFLLEVGVGQSTADEEHA